MHPNIPDIPSTGEIREILAKRIDQQKQAMGIAVGAVDSKGRRVAAYGKLAKADPRTVDGDTIFEIGSITKVFTALLLADMVERGEAALEDPAAKYLPAGVKMPERGGRQIKLLDLATHSSGLPRLPGNLKPKDPANPYADYRVDDLYEFLSSYTLPRDPGAEVEYSNLGAGLLGHVLALRAGMDFESLIRSRITEPLGMPDTAITLSPSMTQRMATGHNPVLDPVANWDFPTLAGAGALRSSAHDMLTFLEAFLGYKESALEAAMKSMQEIRRPVGKTKFEAGLGWTFLGEIACHDGGTGGFCSFAAFDPGQRTGAVVLSNTFTISGVADIGLHLLKPKIPLANPEAPQQPAEVHIDPQILDNYTGRYQLAADRILEIRREGDKLFAQGVVAAGTGPKFELTAEGEKEFFNKVTGSQITFETDAGGRATSLVMKRAGREPTHAPRVS